MRRRARRPHRNPSLPLLPAPAAFLLPALLAAALPAGAAEIDMDPHICWPDTREFTVALAIGTGGHEVVGLEVEVEFDAAKVELLGIDPGTWLTGSGRDYFFYDHTGPGATSIHLTAAFLGGGWDGAGQLAVCRFRALAEGVCPLEFLHLDVRDSTNVDLGFAHSTGDQIVIEPAVGTEGATWGGIKAQYR